MNLYLESGEVFEGASLSTNTHALGEVVFSTGMSGYLEMLTDPSYYGQIIVFTFPLIGNYGVFDPVSFQDHIDETFESKKIWVKGIIVSETADKFSHYKSSKSFISWCKEQSIPVLTGVDTRALTQTLREKGCIMGSISSTQPDSFLDPLQGRYVPQVSPKKMEIISPSPSKTHKNIKTIAFIDCGAKNGILRNFLERGVRIIRLPFDQSPWECGEKFDGIFISNGPGDPEQYHETIDIVKASLNKNIPIFGICLGNQIIALASGGKTKKMKYGHRGLNQPCRNIHDGTCIITSQNHGYVVDESSLPEDVEVWFKNINDQTVEGIRYKNKPIASVQFHPEACAGPEDAQYLFDEFIKQL